MRDKLVGPQIGKWGQLQEWMTDRDDPKDQHRHTSHLFAVYPGRQISMARTPELAKAAAVSLAARGDGRRQPPRVDLGLAVHLWARLRDGDARTAMVRNLLTYNTLPEPVRQPPALPDGRQLRHHRRHLRNAAAIPRRRDRTAAGPAQGLARRLRPGLRARGGFEVDIAWQDGRLTTAAIRSTGGQDPLVRCGGQTTKLKLGAGQSCTLGPDLSVR